MATPNLGFADDLVGDEHVRHPSLDHGLGLRDLLAAYPNGAQGHLLQRDHRALVGLGVGAQTYAGIVGGVRHSLQVPVQGIEIEKQGRRIDGFRRHTDFGGLSGQHDMSPSERMTRGPIVASGTPRTQQAACGDGQDLPPCEQRGEARFRFGYRKKRRGFG
jgi:hypothetical protein